MVKEKEINLKEGIIADLHIHSRFSRACSKDLNLENLEKWARVKGVGLLGTGDFTHPAWLSEIREKLSEKEGILYSKNGFPFILTGEISLSYTQGKGRRVHLILLAPDFETVDKINSYLDTKGKRDYDGRPIFKISCEKFTEHITAISKDIEIIPAHAWTPWFGVFGSESGFDSLKDAFGSQIENIHAIETGMSSNPEMNWHLSELNNRTIVSFSDLHSYWPFRMGREATIFSSKNLSYHSILKQIRENKILGTIETSPLYGKYHWDGHRLCNFSCSPEKTKELGGICPICGEMLTIGVENRVSQIGDQKPEQNLNKKPYFEVLPLQEVISLAKASPIASKKTWQIYNQLIEKFGNEFNILLNVEEKELIKFMPNETLLRELILKNRIGKIKVRPGFDGEYGKAVLEERQEKLF